MVKALASGRITGAIDVKAFPEFSSIQLSGSSRFFQATIAADRKSFVINDLPPGIYELQVYGRAVRDPNIPDAFETPVIDRRPVTLEAGSEEKLDLGSR